MTTRFIMRETASPNHTVKPANPRLNQSKKRFIQPNIPLREGAFGFRRNAHIAGVRVRQ